MQLVESALLLNETINTVSSGFFLKLFLFIRITRQIQTHADHMSNQLKVSACAVVATFYSLFFYACIYDATRHQEFLFCFDTYRTRENYD